MRQACIAALIAICISPAVGQQHVRSGRASPGRCVRDTIANYVALGSIGCTIGNYLFYDIQYSAQTTGGALLPSVTVGPALNNTHLRSGARLTGLSLVANWLAFNGQSVTYNFSVSVTALLPATGIPGGLAGYSGVPFPSTFLPPNQVGLSSYSYSDSNGQIITGSNLFTDLDCNSCIGSGGGAEFSNSSPQTMTLAYTQVFSADTGGVVAVEQQFTGVQQLRSGK